MDIKQVLNSPWTKVAFGVLAVGGGLGAGFGYEWEWLFTSGALVCALSIIILIALFIASSDFKDWKDRLNSEANKKPKAEWIPSPSAVFTKGIKPQMFQNFTAITPLTEQRIADQLVCSLDPCVKRSATLGDYNRSEQHIGYIPDDDL